jgi:hypothetical protein
MPFRIRTDDLTANIAAQLRAQATTTAGSNTVISKAEQATVDRPLADAIADVREKEGPGSRVTIDEAVAEAMKTAAAMIGGVNQASGQGALYVSQAELRALQNEDPAWGKLATAAYDLLAEQARAADTDPPPAPVTVPADAAEHLAEQLQLVDLIAQPDGSQTSNVRELPDGSFHFDWSGEGNTGTAWMKKIDGEWFIGPAPLSASTLHQATLGMRAYFDTEFADFMSQWPASPHEIQAARDGIEPIRVLFAGEEDPTGLSQQFPLVFLMRNATGSDHGFFVGYDPATGESRGEAFN